MSEVVSEIKRALEKERYRGFNGLAMPVVIEIIKKWQGQYSLSDASQIFDTLPSGFNLAYPKFISDFVVKYLSYHKPNSVLVPYIYHGELIGTVAALQTVTHIHGIVRQDEHLEVFENARDRRVTMQSGDPVSLLHSTSEVYDAVTAFLPLGGKYSGNSLKSLYGLHDYSDLIMLSAAQHLSERGVGIFLTGPSFLFDHRKRVHQVLADNDLYVEAVISVPAGSLRPYTSISTILLIIKRQKPERLFVGEVNEDEGGVRALAENLFKRRQSKVPQLGAFTNIENFVSFEHFLLSRDFEELARKARFQKVAVTDVVDEINLPNRTTDEAFHRKDNSIYLPTLGTSRVVDQIEQATVKPQNLLQLVLKKEVTTAAFLARFLNTTFGRKVRRSFEQGGTIPRISKGSLQGGYLYLPKNVGLEASTVSIDTKISEAINRLEIMRLNLWERPTTAKAVEKKLDQIVKLDGPQFDEWIETLPFPLASILWSYHAEQDVKERVVHLFHFFEAFAVFNAVLLLSGFKKNPGFYETVAEELKETDERYRDWGRVASFGNWVVYGERLAKLLRQLLSSNDKGRKEETLRAFGDPDKTFIEALTHKEVFQALKQANHLRDSWKGHGPLLRESQVRGILTELENVLHSMRTIISDHFESTQFVTPEHAKFSGGVFTYRVNVLMGIRTPFKQSHLETVEAMDDGVMHLVNKGKPYPVPMLPFVRLGPSPEQHTSTAYFYSRLTDKGARYVAYQFSNEPETFIADEATMEALSLIMRR